MSALFNNLKILVDKYLHEYPHKIHILTDGHQNGLITSLTQEYQHKIHISSMISDFSNAGIIILWYNGKKKYDTNLIKFMNEYINKDKIFILIVPKEFDFHYIVKQTPAKSIDAISWLKDNIDHKDENYLIVIRKY